MDGTQSPDSDQPDRLHELESLLRQAIHDGRAGVATHDGNGHGSLERWGTPSAPALEVAALRQELETLRRRANFDVSRIPGTSEMPGGEAAHRLIAKLVRRQTQGTLDQVHDLATQAIVVLDGVVAALEHHLTDSHGDLDRQLDEILYRLARFERPSEGVEPDLVHLRQRVEQLEAAEASRRFRPWYRNQDFEDRFRGSREEMLDRYRDIAERLDGCQPVLDVGFGRGELLELLAARGVAARGVEIDPALVDEARARGCDVAVGDGLATLASCDDASLGGVILIQVVEHLTPQRLLELVAVAFDKLRVGGKLIMETVNPESLYVFAHSFFIDPTHERPVHPAYLEFLCQQVGFGAVEIDRRSWPADDERLAPVNGEPAATANLDKLNQLLFGPGDYAVIATR